MKASTVFLLLLFATCRLISEVLSNGEVCGIGQAMRMVTEQNCAGTGWVPFSGDVGSVAPWCSTRQIFKCTDLPLAARPVAAAAAASDDDETTTCRLEYLKQCGRATSPNGARCTVVPKRVCGPASEDQVGVSTGLGSGVSGGRNPLFAALSSTIPSVDDMLSQAHNKGCQVKVKYVRECKASRDPKCQIVPQVEQDCQEEEELDEADTARPNEGHGAAAHEDGMDLEDVEQIEAEAEAKKAAIAEHGDCKKVAVRECHFKNGRKNCKVVESEVCRSKSEADGTDDHITDRPPLTRNLGAHDEEVMHEEENVYEDASIEQVEEDFKPKVVYKDDLASKDNKYKSEADSKKHKKEEPAYKEEEKAVYKAEKVAPSKAAPIKTKKYEEDLEKEADLQYEDHVGKVDYQEVKPVEKCKQVCETVPERKCVKQEAGYGYGRRPLCAEVKMEDCSVTTQRNHMEICHSVVDKFCKAKVTSRSSYSSSNCKEVEVYVCNTEHEREMKRDVRPTCIQTSTVKCRQIPVAGGYRGQSNVRTCEEKVDRVCQDHGVIEPVAKANTECRTEKITVCREGDDNVRPEDLVECRDVDRKICGLLQSTVLVPDTCSVDFYPTCQVPENTVTKCENVMKKVCRCSDKKKKKQQLFN